MRQSGTLALWQAIMAALSTMVAGTTLGEFVGQKQAGLLALVIASLQSGTAAWQLFVIRETRERT